MINLSSAELDRLRKIAEGGEAEIFEYKNKILKIFKDHINLRIKKKKIEMFEKAKTPSNVYSPIESVYVDGKFKGYLMDKVKDAEIIHQLIKPRYLKTQRITNKDVVAILLDAAKTLQVIHKNKSLVGDISDYNILMSKLRACFIDTDSWGIEGVADPDAYSILFTDPKSIKGENNIKFSLKSEYYNFAVLAFNMLTRIHPFNGAYKKSPDMDTPERMKNKISVLGKHKIKIPAMIPSWKWVSPDLLKTFLEIFEKDKRIDITDQLEDLYNNLVYCSQHKLYYYSKFKECPLCNDKAILNVAPKIVAAKGNEPKVTVLYENDDIDIILNRYIYLSKDNNVVHFESNRKLPFDNTKRYEFSNNGQFAFISDNDYIFIYDEDEKLLSTIDKKFKSNYIVTDDYLYYVDKRNNLIKVEITKKGNIPESFGKVYKPLFGVNCLDELFIVSLYPRKAIVTIDNVNCELPYRDKIQEYAIRFDEKTKNWIFIYEKSNGSYRTVIFSKGKIIYDNDLISYNAQPLSYVTFYNDTIYDPADGKIIGTNLLKNSAKEFNCAAVNEESELAFDGKGFTIITDNKVYRYGQ